MILGGGVAVCLLLSAHRAVIFAIAQLSCYYYTELSTDWVDPRVVSGQVRSIVIGLFILTAFTPILSV